MPEIEGTKSLLATHQAGLGVINLDKDEVTLSFLEEAQKLGLQVSAWTADDEQDILALLKMGVHSITTNRPRLAMALREALDTKKNR